MSSWLIWGQLYLYLVVLHNVWVDTTDEKFIPFIQVFQNCILSSGKNMDSDDGDTASL
jgi:hypothetical protein